MDFRRNNEVHDLERQFKDSIEFTNIDTTPNKPKHREFTPFRTKYDSASQLSKIHTVEQELSRLKDLQSKVLDMQETLEETIDKEVQKTKDREIKELKAQYKLKIRDLEEQYHQRISTIKKEYEDKLIRTITKLKETARTAINTRVAEEVEKAQKAAERKLLEVQLRDKSVIDKLTKMYVDLKEKYKKDVQKLDLDFPTPNK
ncbi:hypothetical protein NEHOM01_0787 [Nematocida homosporus]|uniref:uncharacterized protein n=1 Tax=Nematocida homosporus TaxID=1912981 RepID=UPI002220A386|nr:uncharacterized protein NEHOM01_0787 [Nematocida homosporus]KAI5185372.1 hypothetical protein NEHOM01_0787 [Nematocida homosporus]